MLVLGIGVMVLLAAGMMLRGASLNEAFLVGVSVAVAAVPEGLAATVTIALAQGARAMAARGAIVRRLSAVETLGSASVIATDKTGTLTLNQLRIVEIEPVRGFSGRDVLELGVLASTAELVDGEEGVTPSPAITSTAPSSSRRARTAYPTGDGYPAAARCWSFHSTRRGDA